MDPLRINLELLYLICYTNNVSNETNRNEVQIMQTFTDKNYTGYEFRCYTAPANVGFKHVCDVYKDNVLVHDCTSTINWGDRTWEPYPYKSVFEDAKQNLQALLDGYKKPVIDYGFLNRLANDGYIFDYGELESGETVIIMDSWEQAEGRDEREYVEGQGMVKTGVFTKSVYAKLVDLAEKKLLKSSVQSTIENVEFVFSDEYRKCDNCRIIYNENYGELTWVEDMLLCDKCINSPDRVEVLVDLAKEEVSKALKPTVDTKILEDLGYSLVTDDTFSFAKDRYFVNNVTKEWVDDFIHKYNGFVQIYQVEMFDCPFQIWVSNDNLDKAQKEVELRFG
jgi:hypothetical protein